MAAYVGDGVRVLALRSLEGAPVDPDLAAREIGAAYAEHLVDATTAYPGVDAGLRALHAAGHALALVTNKPAPHARRLLDHFGWTPLFSVILGGGDTPELKPSPLPLQIAMQRTGHSPADTWMVGDHHTDLEAARRAGVRSIFLQSGFGRPGDEKPDLVCPRFRRLCRPLPPPPLISALAPLRELAARGFSTLWKKVFHTMEKTAQFFHAMEKLFADFPHNGKKVSTLWKTFPQTYRRISSRGLRSLGRTASSAA